MKASLQIFAILLLAPITIVGMVVRIVVEGLRMGWEIGTYLFDWLGE